jgi:hypothetical protein
MRASSDGRHDFCSIRLSVADIVKTARPARKKWNPILWVEGFGFSFIIALSWLTELMRLPHFVFGEPFTPNWHRAMLRTVVVGLVWAWVHVATKRLLRRLHHLEEFLRICGWCRKVCHGGEWLTMEEYFNSKFSTQTSHGMCPECLKKGVRRLMQKEN